MQSTDGKEKKSTREILHQTALKAPSQSGVYLWRNAQNSVIYVGKAKNLKNRLSSYFAGNKDIKTRMLISNAVSIEYITTKNEYEAFLLENNLIKKYSPRYNIDLKDGKSYPVLRITNEEYPRLFKTRNVLKDGSRYFGPYPDASALDMFIDTLYKIYPLRHCKVFRKKDTPCLYYHMGQCKAPCCGKISKESYNDYFGEISSLLEGKGDETRRKVEDEMKASAARLDFEKAARLRDGLRALSIMQNQNVVEGFDSEDRDYIAYDREGELVSFTVLKIREGKLLGRDNYRVISLSEEDELVSEFLSAYYTRKEELPPFIYLPNQRDYQLLSSWIKDNFDSDTKLYVVDQEGGIEKKHKAAMEMAFFNAKEDIKRRLRERGDMPAMEELKNLLGLGKLPVRIEGFDIAHIGGKFPVASLISFYNGNPDKKNYRYFRLKTTDGYIDDFMSMREAVSRRYTRLLNEQADLPDLILIDGGIGQVNAVYEILEALDLDIPVAGLAKRDEEIWLPHGEKPICLPKRSDALRLLQRVRDETHRFATSRNQRLRTKENVVSIFSQIDGIGPKKEKLLLEHFSTIKKLSESPVDEVISLLSISEEKALSVIAQAVKLSQERDEKKEVQKKSLNQAGTTAQNAYEAGKIADAADWLQKRFEEGL
ncbi:MAG: excinuclease ABC subunit UvrC [Treponema sp.]|nr:excinuclease ABC subunit UvrC [Treponema sp.]